MRQIVCRALPPPVGATSAPWGPSLNAVHVVIAPDCFTGTLTATQAAEAIAAGWSRAAPHCVLTQVPLSDGGPGFLDVLAHGLTGEMLAVTVSDPLGREGPVSVLVVDEGERTAGRRIGAGGRPASPGR